MHVQLQSRMGKGHSVILNSGRERNGDGESTAARLRTSKRDSSQIPSSTAARKRVTWKPPAVGSAAQDREAATDAHNILRSTEDINKVISVLQMDQRLAPVSNSNDNHSIGLMDQRLAPVSNSNDNHSIGLMDKDPNKNVYGAKDYHKGSIKESYDEDGNNYSPEGLMEEDVYGVEKYVGDRRESRYREGGSECTKQRTLTLKTKADKELQPRSAIFLLGQGTSKTIVGDDVDVSSTSTELERSHASELESRPAATELERMPAASELYSTPAASELESRSRASELTSRPDASELERRSGASELERRPGASDLESMPTTSTLESMPNASELGKRSAASELEREEAMPFRQESIVMIHQKCESAVSCASERWRPPPPSPTDRYPHTIRDLSIIDSNTLNCHSNTLNWCHTSLKLSSRLYSISEQYQHSTTGTGAEPRSVFGHLGLLDDQKEYSQFGLRRRGGIDADDDNEDDIGDDHVFTNQGPQIQETTEDGQDNDNDGEPSGSVSALFEKAAAIRQMIRDAEKAFSDQFSCVQSLDDAVDVQLEGANFSRSRTSSPRSKDQDYSPSPDELFVSELDMDILKQAELAEEYGGRSGTLLPAEVESASCSGTDPDSLTAVDITGQCLQHAVRFPVCSEHDVSRGMPADSALRLETVLHGVSRKSTTITHLGPESVSQGVSRKSSISHYNTSERLFCQGISGEEKLLVAVSTNGAVTLATNASTRGTMTFGVTAAADAPSSSEGQILIAEDCLVGGRNICRSDRPTIIEAASDECADNRSDMLITVETAGDKCSQATIGSQEESCRNQHAGTHPDSQSELSSENISNDTELCVEGIEQGATFEAVDDGQRLPNPGGAFSKYDTLSDVHELEFDLSDEAEPQVCDIAVDRNDSATTKTPEREYIASELYPLSRVVRNAAEDSSIIDISNSEASMSGYIASSEPEITSFTEVCDSTSVVSWEEDEDEDGRGGKSEQDDEEDRGYEIAKEEGRREGGEIFGEEVGIGEVGIGEVGIGEVGIGEIDRSIHDETSSTESEEEEVVYDEQSRREKDSSSDAIQTEETRTDAIDEQNDQDHPLSSLNSNSELTEPSSGSSNLEDISPKSIAGSASNILSCSSTFDQYSPRNDDSASGSQTDFYTSVFGERSEDNARSNKETENSRPSIFEERSIKNGSLRSADNEESGSSICEEQSFSNDGSTSRTANCSDDSCPPLVEGTWSDVSGQTLFETYSNDEGLPDLISTSVGTPRSMSGDDEQPSNDNNDQDDNGDDSGYTAAVKKRRYVCEVCGTFYSRPENMEGHLLQHAPRPWSKTDCSCRGCGASFYAVPSLKDHMRRNREKVGFMCRCCDAWFPLCDDLLRHLQPPCPALHNHSELYLDRHPLITGNNAVPRLWVDVWSVERFPR